MNRRGFTLFELMIVIGIIAIVAVIAQPMIGNAHESALDAACKSNLHQLAVQCQEYSMHAGFFPWGMIDPSTHEMNYWETEALRILFPREDPQLQGVKRWSSYASYCWDFRRKSGQVGWSSGEMFRKQSAGSVLSCPKCAREKTDNWDGNNLTGYNYNVCYLGFVENDKGKRMYPTACSSVKFPDRVVAFGDGGYSGGPNKFMRAPFQDKYYDNSSSSLRKAGTQAFRHGKDSNRHCNMAFLDGHVQEFRTPYRAGGSPGWVHEESHTAFISSGNGIYGPRGFGIADDDEPQM